MFMKKMALTCTVVAAMCLATTTAKAVTIYSETVNDFTNAGGTDHAKAYQWADDITLATTETIRSVTWRGIFTGDLEPETPLSFELIFYADDGFGVTDHNNVISSTTVTFTSSSDFTKTGRLNSGLEEYEFKANINPTVATAGTTIWFSPLADTRSYAVENPFFWSFGSLTGGSSFRSGANLTGPFGQENLGGFYLILDNEALPSSTTTNAVPEPASLTLALLALGGLTVATGRRRRHHA